MRFYSYVVMINVTVALMLFAVTTPPPAIVNASSYPSRHQKAMATKVGTPDRLIVAGIDVNVPVAVGSYQEDTGSWTVSDDSAFYADASVPVNNSNGATLIYAHARVGLFANLSQLSPGDEAIVYTTNRQVFHYKYVSMRDVSPNDTSVFTESGAPQLVLQTCDGVWDAYRALYSFELTHVDAT